MEHNRFYQSFYKHFTILPCIYSLLTLTASFNYGSGENNTKTVRRFLPNEICKLRETLVHVDQLDNKYYPLVVKLHRCEGACYHFPPSMKKCTAKSYHMVELKVRRMHDRENVVIRLRNHTSCNCPCTDNANSCDEQTQTWNKYFCRCLCKPGAQRYECHPPYQWNSRTCRCQCNLHCNEEQYLDNKNCMCFCKQKHYETCLRLNRFIDPKTCRCMPNGERSTGKTDCKSISTKWIAVLIFMGFLIILVLFFDCLLYGKKTGILFKLSTICQKRKQPTEETGHCISLQKDEHSTC